MTAAQPANTGFQEAFARRFRALLSGSSDGTPPWLDAVARGDEPGFFRPSDAPWVVHRDFATLVGGIRALLMQALHPGSLAGVAAHSRYESDPLGRLAGTIRWLTVTTFGGESAVHDEARRVNRMHERVAGTYESGSGEVTSYRASDEDLLRWVHTAFMESFLVAHEWYSSTPIPAGTARSGADNYVAQWARSVAPLGLDDVPRSRHEMDSYIDALRCNGTLVVTDDTRRIIEFIRRPPLPVVALPIYRLLFAAAVISIKPELRRMLELTVAPAWAVRPTAKALLRTLRWAVGPESPIEDAALARLRRIGQLADEK